jgi:hypothetical protein
MPWESVSVEDAMKNAGETVSLKSCVLAEDYKFPDPVGAVCAEEVITFSGPSFTLPGMILASSPHQSLFSRPT